MSRHLFISHASEDKDAFVRPLAEALRARGVRVWYDEFDLRVGDSLRKSIDQGLAECSFGLVVLSPSFFGKRWTNRELDGLVAREMAEGRTVVLPVWYQTSFEEVARFSPTLANTLALEYLGDMDALVTAIGDRFHADEPYVQLGGEHRVILTSRDGSTAKWQLQRTVQVGSAELSEMELRVSTKGRITPSAFSPGEFEAFEDVAGVTMALVRFSPAMQPGDVFTQTWVFEAEDMYTQDTNAAILSPRAPYETYTLAVETEHPGSIRNVQALKKVGLGEVPLGPIVESAAGDRFEVRITNPEVGISHILRWDRSP